MAWLAGHQKNDWHPGRQSDGQALAALGATSAEDGTTGTRFHADTKPMGALAAGDRRLESAFHGESKRAWVKSS